MRNLFALMFLSAISSLLVNSAHFPIIQSLIRIGLGSDNPAFRKQVSRLKDSFASEGDVEEAKVVERLLQGSSRSSSMQPSRVSPSFLSMKERLTSQTTPPVDKETGAPLAQIIFPDQISLSQPILEQNLRIATDSIVEEWQRFEVLQAAGVSPTSTCLFYGPPGTGKTQLALTLGQQLGLPVVLARLDGVISSFLGTTGRNVANLFEFANRYTCLLLLDEFDAIAKLRDDPQEVGEIKRVVNALLQNIDLRREKGFTIAITNHEQLLDSAVWRRFDVRIAIQPPTFSERLKIVARYFEAPDFSETSAQFVAWLSEGMTGGDIETMAKHVKRFRALNPEAELLSALKQYSVTQAGRECLRHQSILKYSPHELAKELHESPQISLTQKEIGHLLSTSQPQIGRWLKENQEQ